MAAPIFGRRGVVVCMLLGYASLSVTSKISIGCAFAVPAMVGAEAKAKRTIVLRPVVGGEQSMLSASSPEVYGLAVVASAIAAARLSRARSGTRGGAAPKTPRSYTTQEILPALTWLPAGCKAKELDSGELFVACLAGVDICFGKTESGKLFAVADKCPPTGTSLCIGGEVIGNTIVDPQYGTRFDVFTGEPAGEFCPSPPILGGIVGTLMGGPTCVAVFECREAFLSGEVEVLVDINTRKRYEAAYWKGLLDAQGKNDGTYY